MMIKSVHLCVISWQYNCSITKSIEHTRQVWDTVMETFKARLGYAKFSKVLNIPQSTV